MYSEVFEPFLKAYIDEFKYKSIDTEDWKKFLYKFFKDKVNYFLRCLSHIYCHASVPYVRPYVAFIDRVKTGDK